MELLLIKTRVLDDYHDGTNFATGDWDQSTVEALLKKRDVFNHVKEQRMPGVVEMSFYNDEVEFLSAHMDEESLVGLTAEDIEQIEWYNEEGPWLVEKVNETEFTRMEYDMLIINQHGVRWEGVLKHTNIHIETYGISWKWLEDNKHKFPQPMEVT